MEIVTCPDCGTKLKLKSTLAPGKSIKCPRCSVSFSPGEDEEEETRPAARGKAEKPKPVRRRDDEDEEDDEPDDRPARPRKGKKRAAAKSGGSGLIVMLVIGGILLLGCGVGAVLLVVFWPFGGGSPLASNQSKQEAAARDMVKLYDEAGDALESVKDPASAQAAAPKLNQIADRMGELEKRMKSMPRLSPDEEKRIAQAVGPDIGRATGRASVVAGTARRNSAGDPTFAAALQRFHEAGVSLQGNK